MREKAKGSKGLELEELLRAYFLRAGFFVARGVAVQHVGEDLTDVDIWLYERPTGSSRRIQIVDAKSKNKPKAVERLLWTKGLAEFLGVDGAYVATTDSRPMIRRISKQLGISLLDGADLRRIGESEKVAYPDRVAEEEFLSRLVEFDRPRRDRTMQGLYADVKTALVDGFGSGSINRGLDNFGTLAALATSLHPGSGDAEVATRVSYFAASIVALSIDFVLSEFSFRTIEERRVALINAVRFGNTDSAAGRERIIVATQLLRKYGPNGEASGNAVESAVNQELQKIPAEILGDYVAKYARHDELFQIAKRLEHHAFSKLLPKFDSVELDEKSFLGVLLDFTAVDRSKFASAWIAAPAAVKSDARTLFSS
jgi:hypothetical protein